MVKDTNLEFAFLVIAWKLTHKIQALPDEVDCELNRRIKALVRDDCY